MFALLVQLMPGKQLNRGNKMTHSAKTALRAATLRNTIGATAARLYAHNQGVSALYRLACQLQAVEGGVA